MENTDLISWMAWTWPTAAFFVFILPCLVGMTVWEYSARRAARRATASSASTPPAATACSSRSSAAPSSSSPGSASSGTPLWAPLASAVVYAFIVFRWV